CLFRTQGGGQSGFDLAREGFFQEEEEEAHQGWEGRGRRKGANRAKSLSLLENKKNCHSILLAPWF
ncbi:MAG: hypothetical protein QGH41_13480, partial [Roseibacillus sp.]|nr:hypothetical protein [Roseibacillus sp.]